MRRVRDIVLAILLALAVVQPAAPAEAAPEGGARYAAPDSGSATQVILRVKAKASMRSLEARLARDGARILRRSTDGESIVVQVPSDSDSAGYAKTVAGAFALSVAEPLGYVAASAVPTDPRYPQQWGLPAIGAPVAWDYTWGSADVVVAVIDSGVDSTHPDLNDNIAPGGWDFVGGDSDPTDMNGHGTHVAGIVAAENNNGLHGTGAAPDCKILPIRVLDAAGQGDTYALAQAIRWATDHRADVINMSLGGKDSSAEVRLAVDYALAHDVVLVAASGNTAPGDPTIQSPAREPGVVAVGAVTQSLAIAAYSNRGPALDIVGPGGDASAPIYSTYLYSPAPGGDEAYMIGTSMATPFVAGTVALMRSRDPQATQAEIVDTLTGTAADLGTPGRDDTHGYGLVQAGVAVQAADPAAPYTTLDMSTAANGHGWHTTVPTITLVSDQPAVTTYYQWDGGVLSTYTAPFDARQGTHTLTYWSRDAAGDVEIARTRQFRVDSEKPTTPVVSSAVAVGTTTLSLGWSPSVDAGSGLASYTVNGLPGDAILATTTGTSVRLYGLAPGTAYTMRVVAHDVAGNESLDSGTVALATVPSSALTPVYRFYNSGSGTHFYTSSATERDRVIATWPKIFTFEGAAYSVYAPNNTQPLYRFYNRVSGSHFYTAASAERDTVIASWPHIYTYEGETYRVSSSPEPDKIAVYRFWNLRNGSHFFTASAAERDIVIARWPGTYLYEGPVFWLGQ